MTLIVSIGLEIDVIAQTDPAQAADRYRCVVGGLQASSALINHDGNQEGVAIQLTPVGCRALFGMPARELWNMSGELEAVIGGPATELWERIQLARDWEERFAVCDDVFSRLLVEDALEPGLDQAHLTREFTELAGVPPGRLLADDLPSVQDTDAARRDHWAHEQQPNIRLADPHLP
jgi:hypothetical protein